ncbi:MAG: imidazole glycerol phosphate synthase subunit HisH [Actinomycetota bacterium]
MTDGQGAGDNRLNIAVLDYGIGNLRSAQKAMERVGAQATLTDDPETIEQADGVILPGVGNFGACMNALVATGLADQARKVAERGQPFLGICVGMQMLFEGSDESPDIPGLGILPGRIEWLPDTVKRPQMQWNQLQTVSVDGRSHPLLDGLSGGWVYFVHSLAPVTDRNVIATTDYGGPVVAAVARDNVYATQFHPEKSAAGGLRLLGNFLACCRAASPTNGESA